MEANNEMKPYVIGLDLGGTNSVFGIVDSRGDIKATTAVKTQAYEKVEDYVKACVDAVQVIIDQTGGIQNIKAMGIGAPNGNYYTGCIEFVGILRSEERTGDHRRPRCGVDGCGAEVRCGILVVVGIDRPLDETGIVAEYTSSCAKIGHGML